MAKVKDFFAQDVAGAIEKACIELGLGQEALNIDVIETGSTGIFGLCRKKAHIRATLKKANRATSKASVAGEESVLSTPAVTEEVVAVPPKPTVATSDDVIEKEVNETNQARPQSSPNQGRRWEEAVVLPDESVQATLKVDLEKLLGLMELPSLVEISLGDNSVNCVIAGAHDEAVIGPEGRTLDNLQYLFRKMVNTRLQDRVLLTLDAGNFRQRRVTELCERAQGLAEQVRETGKTQGMPALNPSERRVVHMALQDEEGIRSRSVGEGLFKKVLIFKPGKGKKSGGRPRGSRSERNTST